VGKFGSLFHDDAVVIIDAGPRPNPQADPRVVLQGREAFIAGMSASLEGVQIAQTFFCQRSRSTTTPTPTRSGGCTTTKTPVVKFNGYGHISHDYLKVDGQWKIIRGRTTRSIVDEEWLTEPR
jgi:hypothetical protein